MIRLLIIIFVGLAAAAPSFVFGHPAGHAAAVNLAWMKGFAEQLWSGVAYPRWLPDQFGGLGSPVFYIYGAVPYFVAGALDPLFAGEPAGWRSLGVSGALFIPLSGLTAYAWLRGLGGGWPAAAGAILYMVAPYHLGVDFYARADLSETAGLALAPLVMLYAQRAGAGDGGAVGFLAIAYGLLLMSHTPSALAVAPIALVSSFVLGQDAMIGRVIRPLAGLVFGFGLAALYVAPAISLFGTIWLSEFAMSAPALGEMLFATPFETLSARPFALRLHLAFAAAAGLLVLALILWLAFRPRASERADPGSGGRALAFWLVAGACLLTLTTAPAEALWRQWPLVANLYQPWRLLGLAELAAAAAMTAALAAAAARGPGFGVATQCVALLIAGALLAGALWQAKREIRAERGPASPLTQAVLAGVEAEVNATRWRAPAPSPRRDPFARLVAPTPTPTPPSAQTVMGAGAARILAWTPENPASSIRLAVETPRGARIRVSQYYYPSWRVRDPADPEAALDIYASEGGGWIEIEAPPGARELTLYRTPLEVERWSALLSLATATMILVYALALLRADVKSG